jgi:phosphatidylserine decarboxylase
MTPIRVKRRSDGTFFEEKVLGGGAVEWAYSTTSGRIFLAAVGKHRWFSVLYGAWLGSRFTRGKIKPFVRDFAIDMEEAVVPEGGFRSFNDFFIRALKPGARPMPEDQKAAILPADGRHLVYPDISAADGFVVKGQRFTPSELLGDEALGRRYEGGCLVICRLCPVDYHRFHFPCSGIAGEAVIINGPLYSVSPIALRRNVRYLAENKRARTLLESDHFGTVAIVEIGATMVGSIRQTYRSGTRVERGQEKGWFEFGGSSCALLFERGRLLPDADLVEAGVTHTEVYDRMGGRLGVASPSRM